MAHSFIGKPISLISHSDVRYRGILAGIDPAASTIQLSNVFSMGTESRRPPAEFIPPNQEPYTYIIFRASEVKDLAVDEPAPRRSVHDDPAVLGASAPTAPTMYPPYPVPAPVPPQQPPQIQPQQVVPPRPQTAAATATPTPQQPQAAPQTVAPPAAPPSRNSQNSRNGRTNSIHTAAASLETVERALGDLRLSNNINNGSNHTNHHPSVGRGGRRGRGSRPETEHIKVPTTDFDFQSSNAKFDKGALSPAAKEVLAPSNSGDEGADSEKAKEKEKPAYNPSKSFFDSLSSSAATPGGVPLTGNGGGRGRRGGGVGGGNTGRNRREEERERNVATFGEPGGVGLMGPGAYVGGWGGYGRRGGRPRRGGPRGGQSSSDGHAQIVSTRG